MAIFGTARARVVAFCVDDADLVTAIRGGDEEAWITLVDRHSGLVWRMARTVVTDDALATDAMQTAWLRLLEHLDRLEHPRAVKSWLITTARREALVLSKSQKRQEPSDPDSWNLEPPDQSRQDPAAVVTTSAQHITLIAELRKLSAKCQQLLTLHAHSVAYTEIAEVMAMAVGSIGPTKARCLENLRRSSAIQHLGTGQ